MDEFQYTSPTSVVSFTQRQRFDGLFVKSYYFAYKKASHLRFNKFTVRFEPLTPDNPTSSQFNYTAHLDELCACRAYTKL